MNKTFEQALEFVLRRGDRCVNNDENLRGEEFMGINRFFHPEWMGWYVIDQRKKNLNDTSMLALSESEVVLKNLVRNFYFEKYWKTLCADMMPEQLAMTVFDSAVVHGCNTSIKFLQKAMNNFIGWKQLEEDGILRKNSRDFLANMLEHDEIYVKMLVFEILRIRAEYCDEIYCGNKHDRNCYRKRISDLKIKIHNMFKKDFFATNMEKRTAHQSRFQS